MISVEQFESAVAGIKGLNEQHAKAVEVLEATHRGIMREISRREQQIREEMRACESRYRDDQQALDEQIQRKLAPFEEIENQAKRFFALIDIARAKRTVWMGEVYGYTNAYPREKIILPILDVLATDQYKCIGVWIAANDKPKNKFSLIVRGWSLFGWAGRLFLDQHRGYLSGIDVEPRESIAITLRDAPSEADLQAWYEKNKASVLKDCLAQHTQVEAEYVQAVELLKDPGWRRLYLEDKRNYYEHQYSRGTETPEYKAVTEELAVLVQYGGPRE